MQETIYRAARAKSGQRTFSEYFRCPAEYGDFRLEGDLSARQGFFKFGPDLICYGRLSGTRVRENVSDELTDASIQVRHEKGTSYLPFELDEVVQNLRRERYYKVTQSESRGPKSRSFLRKTYYAVRPALPVPVRKYLQQAALRGWDRTPFPRWPVDQTVDRLLSKMMEDRIRANGGEPIPFIWFWPDGFSSCAIVTHDVETAAGRDACRALMDLDESYGIKSSFQLIPEDRYEITDEFLVSIRERGFEVNVHDLNHDGNLFRDRREFLRRAARINSYGKRFGALGYRSGALYRNLDWYELLDFSYDMSVPNTGHLDPQSGGCCTTKPYFIGRILEIPVTTTQDYTLFHILRQYSTEVWEQQIQAIREQNGIVSFIVHPDYLSEKRAHHVYVRLLERLAQLQLDQNVWVPLPRDVNNWWRRRSQLSLAKKGGSWHIEGPDRHRARIAFASLEGDHVVYTVSDEQASALYKLPAISGGTLAHQTIAPDAA
jgi:hypothetical protein